MFCNTLYFQKFAFFLKNKNYNKFKLLYNEYNTYIQYSNNIDLKNTIIYLNNNLTLDKLLFLSNVLDSIDNFCTGDGKGLIGGTLTEMIFQQFLSENINNYVKNNKGESDIKINDIPFSFKKISGTNSQIALSWSKNKNIDKREYFTCPIIILNLNKNKNKIIKRGIYIVDNYYCKSNIILSTGNKTNTLIKSRELIKMLNWSYNNKLFIEIPNSNVNMKFNILSAFLK